jgi:hypothetical protein
LGVINKKILKAIKGPHNSAKEGACGNETGALCEPMNLRKVDIKGDDHGGQDNGNND